MSIATQTYRGYVAAGGVDSRVRRGFAAYTGLPQPAPAGYQYETLASVYVGGGKWLGAGASPALQIGDVVIPQLVTSPSGFLVIPNSDGTVEIVSAGNTSRQNFHYEVYRVAANTIDGPAIIWDNEVAPIWNAAPAFPQGLSLNVAIVPILLSQASFAVSTEGDSLTFSLALGAYPPGMGGNVATTGILDGAPTGFGTFSFSINATDSTGSSTASGSIVVNVLQNISNVVGNTIAVAVVALANAGIITIIPINCVTYPPGVVAAQIGAGGSLGSAQTLFLSQGPLPSQERYIN